MATSIRIFSILIATVLTAGYVVSLYLLTYAACFMHAAACFQGWVARTIGTMVYLAGVATTILLTRWILRALQRKAEAKLRGMM